MADQFSALLSRALDSIGYSKENISIRAHRLKEATRIFSKNVANYLGVDLLAAGSKAEGVSQVFASDMDFMIVMNDYISVDFGHIENGIYVIQRHFDESPPGYIKLRPLDVETGPLSPLHLFSMYITNLDIVLLSSNSFRNYVTFLYDKVMPVQGLHSKTSKISGPALALTVNRCLMDEVFSADLYADFVVAIPYYSSSLPDLWEKRKRLHDWPSAETIKEVSTTEGYVVPVGHKISEEQNFEWRVCYTTGEQKLVASLNEVQIKLYILLKMINTCTIKPHVDCISSYMIKNIVMWVSEMYGTRIFMPQNLTRMVLLSLTFLRNCLLYSNFLPNYMISERNLLFGKVDFQEKLNLGNVIVDLLNDGENMFLRCEKLRNAMLIMHENPTLLVRFGAWKNEIEEIFMLISVQLFSKIRPDMVYQSTFFYDLFFEYLKDESFVSLCARLINLLSLDIRTMFGNGFQSLEDIDTWLNNLFS